MKLWKITLVRGLHRYDPCYVVAADPTSAEVAVKAELAQLNYGAMHQRDAAVIELVAATGSSCTLTAKLLLPNEESERRTEPSADCAPSPAQS